MPGAAAIRSERYVILTIYDPTEMVYTTQTRIERSDHFLCGPEEKIWKSDTPCSRLQVAESLGLDGAYDVVRWLGANDAVVLCSASSAAFRQMPPLMHTLYLARSQGV